MTPQEISELIKTRRKALHYSLEKVASDLGINRSTVYRWEQGDISTIKRSHLYLLSKILYIPIETLLGLEGAEMEDIEVVKARLNVIDTLNSVKRKEDLEQVDKYIKVFILDK